MQSQPEQQKNKQTIAWAMVVVLGLATAMFGYLFTTQKSELTQQESMVVEKARELALTKTKLDSISTVLDAKIAEIEKLGGDVSELTKVKEQLEKDKLAFRRSNKVETGKYLAKIKEYEKFLAEKDEVIAQLKLENEQLTASNDSLSTHVGTLTSERQRLVQRQAELTDSVVTFTAANKELSAKVSQAAALKAQNLKVLTVNSRGKTKDKDEYKAKRVDKLKLTFTLPENALTAQESKDIYLRVLDPQGAVVADDATGSGEFEVDGSPSKFTARESVAYQNNNQKVEMLYDNAQLRPGKYSVELYSEGYKIGGTNFTIK
jgi:cell division protein FtsB